SLESNEDDSVTLNADVEEGELKFILTYSDENNIRRTIETSDYFDSELFSRTVPSNEINFSFVSFIYGILFLVIVLFIYNYFKRRKNKPLKH
ncbi:MAG: hypothetical protein Q8P15_02705, partial [Nanoarchaeota archaeon]|nr:hypothetical protein [Nanoarchaeota archaeon]